jgi:Arc/MetJ-type ribon-helix-helix transcriptional regulator
MSRSLHVRLDDTSTAALNVIRSEGLSDSEAVRMALRETAARRRTRSSIIAEVQQLAADDADRAEMQAIREQMADLAPQAK